MSEQTAQAQFSIELTAGVPLLDRTDRMDFMKTWSGDLVGSSVGVMLSAGDPASGNAGYVALEVFTGSLHGRAGGFAFQQFGTMSAGTSELRYEIAPGSGMGELAEIAGVLDMDVVDGVHHATLRYTL